MIKSLATLAASDIRATLAYYKDVLGFESTWTYGDPPVFGTASSGGVTIAFALQPELAAKIRGHQHGIHVRDIDELYGFHASCGAEIVEEIEDKPWGQREYVVEDINGYHLHFSGHPKPAKKSSKAFPEGVIIERRVPTSEEFARVTAEAFGGVAPLPDMLEDTWSGVAARSPDGEVIGVMRIVRDAPEWFSIWAMAVVPDWQACRIGSAMMREALEMIQAAAPGACVYLFTYKQGFYERLGFTQETVSMRRL